MGPLLLEIPGAHGVLTYFEEFLMHTGHLLLEIPRAHEALTFRNSQYTRNRHSDIQIRPPVETNISTLGATTS